MKKMMIALAAVVVGFAAQAATVNWKASSTTVAKLDGTVMSGAEYYLFMFDSTAAANAGKQSIIAGLRDGSITDMTKATGYVTGGTLGTDGKIAQVGFTTEGEASATYYFVAFVDGGDYTYMSANKSGSATTLGSTSLAMAIGVTTMKDQATTGTAPGWYQTVPEPTSGLLMLVGLGALALRRCRA